MWEDLYPCRTYTSIHGRKHDNYRDNKYRQIQVLEILNDQVCNKLMAPYQGRLPTEGMGQGANMGAGFLS